METAWFICSYKRREHPTRIIRYCAMDDFSEQIIRKDGGAWAETEVQGGLAIVKVLAEKDTIATIASTEGFDLLPVSSLSDSLASVSSSKEADFTTVLGKLSSATGGKEETVQNIKSKTLGDVLQASIGTRYAPRYDAEKDVIVLDGPAQSIRSLESVDSKVKG